MNDNRIIMWQKWVDPFGADTKDAEWPGAWGTMEDDEKLRIGKLEDNGWQADEDDEDEDELDGYGGSIKSQRRQMGILSTPMGVIPITEHTNPSKVFNFWTMHTNFRMTKNIKKIVDETHGVECLDIFTPYRWRIAIGKAFDTSNVKTSLQRNLEAEPEGKKNAEKNS